jgi:hypothetical protein
MLEVKTLEEGLKVIDPCVLESSDTQITWRKCSIEGSAIAEGGSRQPL